MKQIVRTIMPALLIGVCVASYANAQSKNSVIVPPGEQTRIHAILAPYDYYPARLPANVIFITWTQTQLTPMVCGINVNIEFAARGADKIIWSSSRACNSDGRVGCSSSGYPGYGFDMDVGEQTAVINSRRVYFSAGNHGSNAWACIPLHEGGSEDMAVVGIWESNFITPREAMQLVANARPAALANVSAGVKLTHPAG